LALFRSRPALQLEILAFRHQLGVLQRSVKRPNLTRFDRLLWAAAVTYLAGLAVGVRHRQAGNGDRMASQKFPLACSGPASCGG
jgi:hypothetical protein